MLLVSAELVGKLLRSFDSELMSSCDSCKNDSKVGGSDGSIDNKGIAEALKAFLDQGRLNQFIDLVRRQSPRHIDPAAAETLVDIANGCLSG